MYAKVCRYVGYILYTFCMCFVCISCMHLLQFLYAKCIHDFCVCHIWRRKLRCQFSENLVLWIYEFLFNSGDRISKEKNYGSSEN